jgi:hypothetical protein
MTPVQFIWSPMFGPSHEPQVGRVPDFPSDPTVPFTNNLAERDKRMIKLRTRFRGLPVCRQRGGFRRDQIAAFAREKAGMGSLTGTDQPARSSDRGTSDRLIQKRLPGMLPYIIRNTNATMAAEGKTI